MFVSLAHFCFRNGEGGVITGIAGIALPFCFILFITLFIYCCCQCCGGCEDEDKKMWSARHVSQIKHFGLKAFGVYVIFD